MPSAFASVAAHGLARNDQLDRANRSDDPRQALRSSGAGEQAELDLRKAEFRFGRRNPEMTPEHELESAAERCAVDRGDDGFGECVEHGDHVPERR